MKIQANIRWHFLLFLAFPCFAYAQYTPTPLDDLAYAINQTSDEELVLSTMQSFTASTSVTIRATIIFEKDEYESSVKASHQHWLANQAKGISMILTVAPTTLTYKSTDIQISASLAGMLTSTEKNHIIRGIMEPLFHGSPVPNDAYTQGLIAGIKALQAALQQNDYTTESLVKEALLRIQEKNQREVDSLRENLEAQRKVYYQIIDNNGWLPWMYAGKDGLFVREGVSQDEKINKQAQPFLGLTMLSEDRRKYSEAKLNLFDQWAAIYQADKKLLHNLATDSLISKLLEEEPLHEFSNYIQHQLSEESFETPADKVEKTMIAVGEETEKRLTHENKQHEK